MIDSRAFRTAFPVLALFTVLAGDAWRYSITWWGFSAIVVAVSTVSVILLVRNRDYWSIGRLPYPLLAFLVLCTVSLIWSYYPSGTALGLAATLLTVLSGVAIAVCFTREELLRALGTALRIILGLSIVFELCVSLFVRAPLMPFWTAAPAGKVPQLLYWSRDLLLEGGKIQGIVGNSSLLAMVALLGLVVFGVQLGAGSVRRGWGIFWFLVAVATVFMTRSATITLAIAALILVLAAVLLVRRAPTARARTGVYWGLVAVALVAIAAGITFRDHLLSLMGKSDDLTGRLDIWQKVIHLAQERPIFGWGWISYWVPWLAPFDNLVVKGGVRQLHAHNAWIDVWFQLGIIGLIVFGLLVLTTLVRSWSLAVDRPQFAVNQPGRYTAISLLPLLLMVALIMQSLAESRLLVEYGLLLLTVCAVSTKLPTRTAVATDAPATALPRR
ncbi:O-antigen ligase [Glaciihabitans sp. dw_435]|uniref:O-antigen ligase family protein n=1 Tax=Glaciihabitans sp. dw_435 TaxID=2720081 RepID=UPI001BD4F57D|nr:O-antigen ligase family protein [Glaciihabitans sp. dw_435]